jgi:hypothetical protein
MGDKMNAYRRKPKGQIQDVDGWIILRWILRGRMRWYGLD